MPTKKPRIRKPNKKRKQKAQTKRPNRPAMAKDYVEKDRQSRATGAMTLSPEAVASSSVAYQSGFDAGSREWSRRSRAIALEREDVNAERDGLLALIANAQRSGYFRRLASEKETT